MFSKLVTASTVALATTLVSAQTFTSCDPTKVTDCKPDPALGGSKTIDFRNGADDFFSVADGTNITYDKDLGAVFTINTENDAPTITSTKYIFFGEISVVVRAATGTGVVTSFVLQSDDLDEIDWEWLGGDATQVQTNYFSKGCTTVYDRGGFGSVSNPQTTFDTYTINWTPTTLTWAINGNVIRTLNAADATGCDGFPQTPMQIKLGTWVAGKQGAPEGTVQWAGGYTNFADAPFIGYYQSISITDYANGASGATEYVYGDQSGTYESIKVVTGGNSTSDETSSSSSSAASGTSSASSSKSGGSSSGATTLTTATSSASNATATTASKSGSGSTASATAAVVSTSSSAPASASTTAITHSAAGKVALSMSNVALLIGAVFLGTIVL